MSGTMRFTVHLRGRELAELQVVNELRPGGEMLIQAGTRIDSSGAMGPLVYGARILDTKKEPGNPNVTVVTLELPGWQLIPNVGRPVDPATLHALMNSQEMPTPPMTEETFCWSASRVPGSS